MRRVCVVVVWAVVCVCGLVGCSKSNQVSADRSLDCGEDVFRCVECTPGEVDCDGPTLLRCGEDGLGFAVVSECESAQLCAEGLVMGACEPPLCVAGDVQCVGSVMQICAAGRHRYDLLACASADACLRGVVQGVCAAGECAESSDCTGEDTQCRRRRCVEGRCEVESLPRDTACEINGVNGACDGDGACRATDACTIASDCPGQDTACRLRACQDGACFLVDLPSGTPCETPNVNGECNGEGACVAVAECDIATDCPGQDTQCQIRACVAQSCSFVPLPEGSVCDIGGLAGACDGAGACAVEAQCNTAGECPGQDTACRSRACVEGSCTFAFAEEGAFCEEGGLGGACDGAGSCALTEECRLDGECPGVTTECQRPACVEGACTTVNLNAFCTVSGNSGVCRDGVCVCMNGQTLCNGSCVTTDNNPDHCGACNNACDTANGWYCNRFSCQCPNGWADCDGECVDIINGNPNHCGGCDGQCPDNASCYPRGTSLGGCVNSNQRASCFCDAGHQVCFDPTNNPALEGECVLFASPQWDDAGCQTSDGCTRSVQTR